MEEVSTNLATQPISVARNTYCKEEADGTNGHAAVWGTQRFDNIHQGINVIYYVVRR